MQADEQQTPSHLQPESLPLPARRAVMDGLAAAAGAMPPPVRGAGGWQTILGWGRCGLEGGGGRSLSVCRVPGQRERVLGPSLMHGLGVGGGGEPWNTAVACPAARHPD